MKNLLFFLFLIITLNAFGQIDYRSGYVILKNSDTTRGSINYVNDVQNSKACVFKQTPESALTTYYPGEISAYRFNDSKYFVSKNIFIDGSDQILFLEFLLKGRVNIYYCRTPIQDHYFIEKDTIMKELDNSEVEIKEGDITNIYRPQEYKGLMKYLFSDCPSLSYQIDGLKFEKKSIIGISKEYHERTCTYEKCIVYEKLMPKVKFGYGISVNYGLTDFRYALEFYVFDISKMHSNGIDGFINMNIPGWNEQIFLKAALSYLNYKDESDVSTASYDAILKTNITSLGLRLELIYKLPINKISPFINIGTCLYDQIEKSVIYSTSYEVKDYSGDKSGILGLFGGGGVEYKILRNVSLFLSCNYESTSIKTSGFRFATGIIVH